MAFSVLCWAGLPKDILDLILDHIIQFSDYIRFCSVCKSWRSVGLEDNNYHHLHIQRLRILKACRSRLPMLMIPPTISNKENQSFYSVTDGVILDLQLPMSFNRRCFGSSHGWLFTMEKPMVIVLLNPFSGRTIHLPELKDPETVYQFWVDKDDHEYFVSKGILSSDPCRDVDNYEVVVIYSDNRKLASFKSGDETWQFFNLTKGYFFSDIIYYEGQLHAINNFGGLMHIDTISGAGKIIIKPTRRMECRMTYLVKSYERDLLMVQKFMEENEHDDMHYKASDFKIFKMVHSTQMRTPSWVEINSIGDQALFVGNNYSLTVSTSDFSGCSSNCIYYTDHYLAITGHYVPHGPDDDTGIFNLRDRSFGSHYIADREHLIPPIWIVPNLKDDTQPI
ncbi:unnamed protein product [Ilex paraguariensis]|uniref:F-box domain-containing protein n=1 Tax=Ilex paraguariensis TaxID=185542 RepID=A0ABC8UT80_9AQUA